MIRLERRRMLKWLVGAVLLLGVRRTATGASGKARGRPSTSEFTTLFRNRESAAEVGRAYLAHEPSAGSVKRLTGFLRQRLGAYPSTAPGRRRLRARFATECAKDFETGYVVMVRGWMLSRTEARACALVALTTPS